MPNRRQFLKHLGYSAAGIALMSGPFPAMSHNERRHVEIGGKPVTVVDVHAHCGIPAVEEVVKGTPFERTIGGIRLLDDKRLTQMNKRGVDIQALSINQYWWYGAAEDLAAEIVRVHDEGIAAWCNEHPDRFVGLTSVALQHPELAAEQLDYAVNELDMRGASIGGHVGGEAPSAEKYDPFWAKAAELDVPVFMHPTNAENVVKEGGLSGRGDLPNIIGNPLETAVFLSHMIYDGTLDRFPDLKICAAHGGGYMPSYLGRFEVACEVRRNPQCLNEKKPSEYLKTQILADSMVFSGEGLRHLVAEMGAGQVVYGSDMPFNWPDTIDVIANASFLSDEEKRAILGGNLIELLRIET